ncbi:DRC1 protein, partial [Upupa epops]|nr:DRC1 protein [Upupa epops]
REALGEDEEAKVAEEEEEDKRRRIQQQIEENSQKLARLLLEGTRLVTDIQVAADLRETQRRAAAAKQQLQRVEKLENEAESSMNKFEAIMSKWALAKEMTIPQELWQLLDQQQQQCVQLLEDKNKLIADLQQELKTRDEEYVQTVRKHSDDISLLLERMEEQIRFRLKTYRRSLLQTEKALELEQQELQDNHRKKWEEAIEAHKAQELEYLHARLRKVEEFEKQLHQLWVQDEEEYNRMKMQLENYVQNLEVQLQQMKAVYQLNQEKLEYNLQVLKKQDEENTIISSQQKRKINHLRTLLNSLRTKLASEEKQFREENQRLVADCQSIKERCREMQRRMRCFAARDAEKFREVWLMNEREAKGLMQKALDADRIIHTQQLGLPWQEPHYWFLNNVGPLGHYKKRMATKLASEILTESSSGGREEDGREEKVKHRVTPLQNISKKTAKRILELVNDESGFLAEKKLLRGHTLGRHDCTLMKLDSVLEALKIDREDDLYQLVAFFLEYKGHEVAVSQVGPWGTALGGAQQSQGCRKGGAEEKRGRRACCPSLQSQESPGGEDTDPAEDREDGGSGAQEDKLRSPRGLLSALSSVSIHADDVLKILKAFVQEFDNLRENGRSDKEVVQVRDSSKDGEYWEALTHIIPESTLKLWDALTVGLQRYYEVLKHRASLLAETATLRQQNSELSQLLEEYISSRVSRTPASPPAPGTPCAPCRG